MLTILRFWQYIVRKEEGQILVHGSFGLYANPNLICFFLSMTNDVFYFLPSDNIRSALRYTKHTTVL